MKADVVLLPGLHGTRALFDSFVALAPSWASCRPLALPTVGGQTFDALADALLGELRTLEGFVLLGESYSGPIAARLAARLGQRLALLVLCNPVVEMSFRAPERFLAPLMRSPLLPAWCAAIALSGGDTAVARAALGEVRKLPGSILRQRLAGALGAAEGELAARLSQPVLGIVGAADCVVSPSRSRDFFARTAQGTIVELEGPHLIVQTRPREVWAAISEEFESAA